MHRTHCRHSMEREDYADGAEFETFGPVEVREQAFIYFGI